MERWQRNLGRTSAALGLGAGAGWLVWRVGWSLAGTPRWSASLLLAVELAGFVAAALLVWALWPGTTARGAAGSAAPAVAAAADPRAGVGPGSVTVVVRSDGREVPWLEATLLSLTGRGADPHVAEVVVLDLRGRADVAELAERHGAEVVRPDDPTDLNGWRALLDHCTTPLAFVLDAGDVARPDAAALLAAHLADDVAVVQGRVESALEDSAEHRRPGRHERDVERLALGPALGRRGAALLTGAGALVRVGPLRELDPGTASLPMAEAALTAGLLAGGWRLVAPARTAVAAVDPLLLSEEAERWRACEASAARALLFGEDGALRGRGLPWRARLALATWAVRPLAGVRRSITVCLLAATLLSGQLPFRPSGPAIAALWLPAFVLLAAGLDLLSGHTLVPGERARHGWHTLGTSWRGVLAPNGRPDDPHRVLGPAFGLDHGVAPSLAVALLSVVLGLRGLSDRVTHTLEPVPGAQMAGLLVVGLWTLWGALDALRVIARRTQSRRAVRVAASLPCLVTPGGRAGDGRAGDGRAGDGRAGDGRTGHARVGDEHAGIVVDLTPLGAALVAELEADIGDRTELTVVLPTATGCTTARLDAEIRNARLDWTGEHRYGLRFVDPDPYAAEALAELCVIQPALALLGLPVPAPATGPVGDTAAPAIASGGGPRRLGLRAAALVAVTGAVGSAVPAQASAARLGEVEAAARLAGGAATVVDTALPSGSATAVVALGALLAAAVVLGSLPPTLTRRRRPTSR